MSLERTAHPYDDVGVIDRRAPRFNQATVAVVSVAAVVTGWWWLVALLALQLFVGVRFGRRYCLACVFYFEVIQPRFGEGDVEDAAPVRFANIVGASFLVASACAYAAGFTLAGHVLALVVASLALLAAATGFCAGCAIYRAWARLRGIRWGRVGKLDLTELGVPADERVVVGFTHRLCTGCQGLERRLRAEGHRLVMIDTSERPDLARKYRVAVVPAAFAVGADGKVLERLA
jgi:hypothetical protein